MKTIVVASTNPVKVRAAKDAFEAMFPEETFAIQGASVPSGVDHQPKDDKETYEGAKNRAEGARKAMPEADFWVGIEAGIEDVDGDMKSFSWIVVVSKEGLRGKSRGGSFFLPAQIATLIRQGLELGDADDQVFGKKNSKQENGAIGLLTGNVIDRAKLYAHATMLALIPFKNPALYPKE